MLLAACLVAGLFIGSTSRDRGEPSTSAGHTEPSRAPVPGSSSGRTPPPAPEEEAAKGQLGGVARGADGQPVGGAQVCAWCEACNVGYEGNRPHCTQADAQGRFTLSGIPQGRYRLVAGALGHGLGFGAEGRVVEVGRDGTVSETGDPQLPESGATVSGRVRDALGGVISQAEVRVASMGIDSSGASAGAVVETDAEGGFVVDVPPGWVRLIAFADGYAPADVTRTAPVEGVELVLAPASSIRGHVRTLEGSPVPFARVTARDRWGLGQQATSQGDGSFEIKGLKPGTYTLEALADGWSGKSKPVSVELASNAEGVTVLVVAGVRVEGLLLASGKACPNGLVSVRPAPGASDSLPAKSRPSGHDGRVVFESLPPGRYEVNLHCGGHGSQIGEPLEVVAGRPLEALWEMRPRARLSVFAVDGAGRPVPRLRIELTPADTEFDLEGARAGVRPRTGVTDDTGRWTFTGLPDGLYWLGGKLITRPESVEVRNGDEREIQVEASSVGEIVVDVRRPDGLGLQQVTVAADPADGTPGYFGSALGNGRFRLGPLPAGSYSVSVRDHLNPRSVHPQPVVVEPAQVTELTLTYGGHDGAIRGRVVDGQGEPLPDVWVSAVAMSQGGDPYVGLIQFVEAREGTHRFTDAQGGFTLDGLDPQGRYRVLAERPSGGQALLEAVAPEQGEVTLVVAETGQLHGRAVDGQGSPLSSPMYVSVRDAQSGREITNQNLTLNADGGWLLSGLAPGELELIANDRAGRQARVHVALRPGERQGNVELVFRSPTVN